VIKNSFSDPHIHTVVKLKTLGRQRKKMQNACNCFP